MGNQKSVVSFVTWPVLLAVHVIMRSLSYIIITLLLGYVTAEEKLAKHFSLFSVVTFGNEECTSSSSVAGGATAGTCYSSTECSDKNGMAAGNCASGFGGCCAFLNTGAVASTITENRTRLRNSEFPSIATATTAQSIAYTINKMNADICQIRLDFDNFIIAGPSVTTENFVLSTGTRCQDSLKLATSDVSTWSQMPHGAICGAMTGEHLYVELSPTSSDSLTATLETLVSGTLTPAIAQRVWDIKVSQIECNATYRAPAGCSQYYMGRHGKIASMNFYRVTGSTPALNAQNSGVHLQTSHIRSCIRREKHMCCTEYQLCASYNSIAMADSGAAAAAGGANGIYNEAWSLDMDTTPYVIASGTAGSGINNGLTDNYCTGDYVEIPSSMSRSCGAMFGSHLTTVNTRYCGSKLGSNMEATVSTQTASSSVCDCSEPFAVTAHFDDLGDGGAALANINQGAAYFTRGFCLDYKQTPCYN